MSDVVIRQGLAYSRPELVSALREMIGRSGGWPERIRPGARVLLKVNMLAAKPPHRGITTHPEIVAAMAELLLERGCRVAAGDSPGGAVGGVERYWRSCGYEPLRDDPGVELVSFEASGSVRMSAGGRSYNIARAVADADALVNMCKFKTHMLCRLTNAVKNSFGAVPGLGKAVIHSQSVRPRDLAVRIVDVHTLVPFDLVVMDGIISMDGRGPSTDGRARRDGVLAVARDGVLLDLVMAGLAGLDPMALGTNREARRRGLGRPPEEISVDGTAVLPGFRVPSNAVYDMVPPFMGALARMALRTVPRSGRNCTGCGFCAASCPAGAIAIRNGRAVMNARKCIVCLCCHELCPENAIVVRNPIHRRRR